MANPPPNPSTNLSAIETKVRRLTRNMSESQLSTAEIDNYINTFILYDFPEHLRTFNLRTTFNFWCNPYQDVYPTDTASFGDPVANPTIQNNPLYNFQNTYLTVHTPVYIAGYNAFYTQSREQFYGVYPLTNSIASIGPAGDGATTTFTGVINSQQAIVPGNLVQTVTLVQNNVLFSSVDLNGNGLSLVDVPVIDPSTGNPTINGNLYVPGFQPTSPPTVITPANTINYVNGSFTITFPTAPGIGVTINSQTIPQVVSLPQAMCFYNNEFILRPVPDQPYQINFEAYIRPTALLNENAIPNLEEYWQYIAYGAAKKIFEDRMDLDSVALIMPEFKKQEALVLRRTIVQYTNERTATIYTEQTSFGQGSGSWGWGGGPF
jgi:hypothetical protein